MQRFDSARWRGSSRYEALGRQFELVRELGRGGMGIVYEAVERATSRRVALKVVLEAIPNERRRKRFQREGEITASLQHPGIVNLHSAGEVEGTLYLAYELVEGARSFEEVLPELQLNRRIEMLADVADALGYAHAQGVLHRDVKPDNVLIDPQGRARVADFGLAAAQGLERLTRTGAAIGTPTHMSPEQVDRSEELGPPCDVWGLGVLLYQALTLELPFTASSMTELCGQILTGDPVRPRKHNPALPADLEAVCLKALSKRPHDRYADGAALATDLRAYLGGTPVSASRSALPRVLRSARSRWIALGMLPVAIALTFAVWLLALRDEPDVRRRDGRPPRLEIRSPPNGFETTAAILEVEGTARDRSPSIEVRIGHLKRRVHSGVPFVMKVPIGEGRNTLEIVAVDEAGNSSRPAKRIVTRISVPPWYLETPESQRPPLPLPGEVSFGEEQGEYVNARDGSVLVYVPPGTFTMGSRLKAEEAPPHPVTITRGFFLGKYEVTWAQYRKFCEATRRKVPSNEFFSPKDKEGYVAGDDHPVTNVSYDDAHAYCTWAGLRLPTEAEWELGAGGSGPPHLFPWGNARDYTGRCNMDGDADGYMYTSPVGAYPQGASPYGCLDMAGNADEWVDDWWATGYSGEARSDPRGPPEGTFRVNRGGNFTMSIAYARVASRFRVVPDYSHGNVGFRVCRDGP